MIEDTAKKILDNSLKPSDDLLRRFGSRRFQIIYADPPIAGFAGAETTSRTACIVPTAVKSRRGDVLARFARMAMMKIMTTTKLTISRI